MRKKYLPIYAVSLFAIALGVACLFAYRNTTYPLREGNLPRVTPLAQVEVPDKGTLGEMMRLKNRLGMLLQPVSENGTPVNLRLFGYVPVRQGDLRKRGLKGGVFQGSTHLLTMVFKGMTSGFCVLDGKFYPQGASLPDGSVIRRVERDRVLLVKGKRKTWVEMAKAGPIREKEIRGRGEEE